MNLALNRIALLIDGANFRAAAKALGFEIDYKRVLLEFRNHGALLRAVYYTSLIEDSQYSPTRPLVDWLDYNGYTVVTTIAKELFDGRRTMNRNIDVRLAVDAMELASCVDELILFAGAGDLRPLVESVQRRGVRVTVISTNSGKPPMIDDELRRQADAFIDLTDLRSKLERDPTERAAPREARELQRHLNQDLRRRDGRAESESRDIAEQREESP